MDCIRIKNLVIHANHGMFPEENTLGQKFIVSATMYTDMRTAGRADDIDRTIHYGGACHLMKDFMESHTYKLLEAVAENMAEMLLLEFHNLQKVELEIQKPWAPIGLPLDTVAVSITRGRHRAYIALGSNIGDREAYLDQAIEAFAAIKGCEVIAVSDFIETEPYGGIPQEKFLNAVMEVETLLEPHELLERLREIETAAKRERNVRWGPRTLDLDILLYDDRVIDLPDLQIPHPDMQNREFVLEPLMQLAPHLRHPLLRLTVAELFDKLKSNEN